MKFPNLKDALIRKIEVKQATQNLQQLKSNPPTDMAIQYKVNRHGERIPVNASTPAAKPAQPMQYNHKQAHEKIAAQALEIAGLKQRLATKPATTTATASKPATAPASPGQVAFVPSANLAPMDRSVFNSMSPVDRMNFVKQGGKLSN